MSIYTNQFKQTVIGKDPCVLSQIQSEDIDLAVLQDPLSEESKNYCEKLPLRKLSHEACHTIDKYYFLLSMVVAARGLDTDCIHHALKILPDIKGKDALQNDVVKLTTLFAEAAGHMPSMLHLMLYRPKLYQGSQWHGDTGHYSAVTTLKGGMGTLWWPNAHETQAIDTNEQKNRDDHFLWGHVEPSHQQFAQEIAKYDFALFRGKNEKRPAIHGSPPRFMTGADRLVLGLGS